MWSCNRDAIQVCNHLKAWWGWGMNSKMIPSHGCWWGASSSPHGPLYRAAWASSHHGGGLPSEQERARQKPHCLLYLAPEVSHHRFLNILLLTLLTQVSPAVWEGTTQGHEYQGMKIMEPSWRWAITVVIIANLFMTIWKTWDFQSNPVFKSGLQTPKSPELPFIWTYPCGLLGGMTPASIIPGWLHQKQCPTGNPPVLLVGI